MKTLVVVINCHCAKRLECDCGYSDAIEMRNKELDLMRDNYQLIDRFICPSCLVNCDQGT